jgi:glucuronyl/N-acetylglucosaminyl transferase EXT2
MRRSLVASVHGTLESQPPPRIAEKMNRRHSAATCNPQLGLRCLKWKFSICGILSIAAILMIGLHIFIAGMPATPSMDSNSAAKSSSFTLRGQQQQQPIQRVAFAADNSSSIQQQQQHQQLRVSPLSDVDREQYTVRINSWKRHEQLRVSIQHFSSCPNVAAIQIVWCDAQGPPPDWLLNSNVSVERHAANTLNERFHVLSTPPTKGILSVDDDVLRPCIALDAGFEKWTRYPNHMVGYDARSVVVVDANKESKQNYYKYGYLSTTRSTNRYALSLTRFCFLHVDYLTGYMTRMPAVIRDRVALNLNCEDIAMSLYVSSHTHQPPLLADCWAMSTQIKLYAPDAISGGAHHKTVRDECVRDFATALGATHVLDQQAVYVRGMFDCGHVPSETASGATTSGAIARLQELHATVHKWKANKNRVKVDALIQTMIGPALQNGLIKGTGPWKERYGEKRQR